MADYRVIVIGGGTAGLCAAEKAARHGFSTLLLEAMYIGGKMVKREVIDDYPGFFGGLNGRMLTERLEKAAIDSGIRILHERVAKMDFEKEEKTVVTDKGVYTADAVILATGMRQRTLGLADERALSGMGIFHSARNEAPHAAGKVVVLVGSGNAVCKEAEILSKQCKTVYLICPDESLGASKKYIDSLRALRNVSVNPGTLVAGVNEGLFMLDSVMVVNRVTTELKTIPAEAVFLAPMAEPDSDVFLGQVRMTDDGAVIVDEDMKTSADGVFAAGAVRYGSEYTVLSAVYDGNHASDCVNRYLTQKELMKNPL